MVGVGGHGVNNAYPTRVTLGFLGLLQAGLVLALEPALARLTARRRVWMATILVNSRIMTVYLWHLTALGIVVAVSLALDGAGLRLDPLDLDVVADAAGVVRRARLVTAAFVVLLGRFEQVGSDDRPPPPRDPATAVDGRDLRRARRARRPRHRRGRRHGALVRPARAGRRGAPLRRAEATPAQVGRLIIPT